VPAEEDDAPVALVREVQEAHVEVLEEHAKLPDARDRKVEPVRLDAVLGASASAAVRARGPQYRLEVGGLLAQGVAVEREVVEEFS
jgi:hypothetical protein